MGLDHGFSDDGYLRANANIWQQSSEAHVHLAGDMGGIRGGEAAMLAGDRCDVDPGATQRARGSWRGSAVTVTWAN